jgi:hypothetical protein
MMRRFPAPALGNHVIHIVLMCSEPKVRDAETHRIVASVKDE